VDDREADFQGEVRRHLRRNYFAHLGHGLFGQTGMRLINAPTFVPAYVDALAGSDLAVGGARAVQYLGMFLSPIVGATLIEHRRRVLPVGLMTGGLMRLMILGLGLGGLLLAPPWSLVSAFAFLGLFGAFLGVQGVVFNMLVAKVIPVELRGRLVGLRNALAGLTATAVALFAGDVLVERDVLGNGYASTFLLAFVLTSFGLAMLLFVREPSSPQVRESARVAERVRALPALLRSDPGFTAYFAARALAVMGRMGMPFYYLYAVERLGAGRGHLGALTGAFVLAMSVGNLAWGVLADRRGFRSVFVAALVLWMLSVGVLMRGDGALALPVVFAGIGAGVGGFQMSAQNLVLEFGARHQLPMRIAVANSASNLVGALAALLGGALSAAFSYEVVFWAGIAFQGAALAIVLARVDEPRRR
jgi:MFS family permease